ncbi:outer membrane beta-barrel protein [Ferrovibrio terrae]|uniref:outer membrane protein n=1 Tax=Ferrovibrio terrae TaxID=2594003 RepID=UPI0031381DA2
MRNTSVRMTMACIGLICFAGTAQAADPDWTGFYTGLTVGTAMGKAEMSLNPTGAFNGPLAADITDGNFWRRTTDLDSAAFTGGLYGGYQVKVDRVVYGLEGEAGYLGLKDSSSITATVSTGNTYRLDQKVETDFFASLRPRVGYVPEAFSGSLLLFATGGVTLTQVRVDQTFKQIGVAYQSKGLAEDKMLVGWTVGGGMEYAMSKAWSLKAEYLYADLGTIENNNVPGSPASVAAYRTNNKAELTTHILRIGTAWHF